MPAPRTGSPSRQRASDNGRDLDVEWEDPPPSRRGTTKRSKWLPYLEEARKHPGKSLVLRGINTSVATNIRNGKYQGIEKGEFEVTTRNVGSKKVDCYITFTGGKKKR